MSSKDVQQILSLVLTFGNYMNGGTARGQADGFDLEILAKLKDVKSKYVRLYSADPSTDRSVLPLPEPSDITKASLINFEDIEQELKKVAASLQVCIKRMSKVIQESAEDSIEPFKSHMMSFVDRATVEIREQEANLDDAKKRFDLCCLYFAIKLKPGEKVVYPKDFFGLWKNFCVDFKDYWKTEQQKVLKERLKEAHERVKQMKEDKRANVSTTLTKGKKGLSPLCTEAGTAALMRGRTCTMSTLKDSRST
ncbi:hypothetical protein NP493_16g12001 [Ridgeia piscesae]|uniref:FH2 domain-containing protein n=1 Tax=Ridgeia piscesae TaxID=27915 RepID=A0AAD9PEH3_RIDPI|nr:hypothetical protein NP493_16g12001 [Ridgeia piscesae]